MCYRYIRDLLVSYTSPERDDLALTTVSRPTRYADWRYICTKSTLSVRFLSEGTMQDVPICSVPLKTYNLQFFVGFLASGGSLYLI
jgi:hypothetical protein